MRSLIAGNWKMNGLKRSLEQLRQISQGARTDVDIVVCVPFTLLSKAVEMAEGTGIGIGAQDCHPQRSGAHTGDISAEMISDCGAGWVIVGHSERRTDHGETDELVRQKAEAAQGAGLRPIVCIGEQADERDAGQTLSVLERQLAGSLPGSAQLAIAYEPVWAIGTGNSATPADISAAHDLIRRFAMQKFGETGQSIPLLYGGSVKAENALEILAVPNVNGALVGGASLKADDFLAIVEMAGKQ